ncbi:MAG: PHP domain-containing protein, partial [Syntrophomonadaceae bacterium]|nr:PHP domain-containing protein [Syntrophomonadaceae bacterium]
MYNYIGNMHIHSTYSDGFDSARQIARIAEKAGLDFIIITDHFNLKAHADEGYYGRLLLLAGMEINEEENHYLAMDITEAVSNGDAQTVINEVNLQQGIGIIAHPDEKGSPLYENYKTYKWNDWSVKGFQGIEVWNYLSQFKDEVTGVLKGIYLLCFPQAALKGPYKETIAKLDGYQKQNLKVFAFGGSDAHGIRIKLGPIRILTISAYDLCFECINTHIISDKKFSGIIRTDKEIVYQALRQGRFWISFDYYKNSQGFQFEVHSQEGKWLMGDEVPWQKDLYAQIKTPHKAWVKFIKDCQVYAENHGRVHRFPVNKAGV